MITHTFKVCYCLYLLLNSHWQKSVGIVEIYACDQPCNKHGYCKLLTLYLSEYKWANPAHQYSTYDVSELSVGKKNHLHAEYFLAYITYSRMTQNYFVLETRWLRNCLRPKRSFLYVTVWWIQCEIVPVLLEAEAFCLWSRKILSLCLWSLSFWMGHSWNGIRKHIRIFAEQIFKY